MSGAETGQMSAVETRQMYSIGTGQSLVSIVDICFVSTADICPVSAADICPVSIADICPVSTEDIYPVSTADILGGKENDFDPFFTPKMFKMKLIRQSPGEPGGARRNGGRDVETEPHQPRVMARITAVKQSPSNETWDSVLSRFDSRT